jgi:hypothetical protein
MPAMIPMMGIGPEEVIFIEDVFSNISGLEPK